MKYLILIFLSITYATATENSFREWESKAGSSMTAELIGKTADEVTFRGEDGKELTVKIHQLSERDIDFIESWKSPAKKMKEKMDLLVVSNVEHGITQHRFLGFDNRITPNTNDYSSKINKLFEKHYDFASNFGSITEINEKGMKESTVSLLQLLEAVATGADQEICARIMSPFGGVDMMQQKIGELLIFAKETEDVILVQDLEDYISIIHSQRLKIRDQTSRSESPSFRLSTEFISETKSFIRRLEM